MTRENFDIDLLARSQQIRPVVHQQVGLALRADRRRRDQSQRAYAAARGLSRPALARAEVDASHLTLAAAVRLLVDTGFELAVIPVTDQQPEAWWDPTDVLARTRDGRRFPANRAVSPSPWGPAWWVYHELVGNRGDGPRPHWSAEGFEPLPGTRYGKKPTLGEDGRARWPFNVRAEDVDC